MGRPYLSQTIRHDSHPHPLHFDKQPSPARCAARGNPTTPPSNHAYICKPCTYTLHASCGTLPNVLSQPSHPHHDLELLFTPAYLGGSFECDACGVQGTAFSYHCEECSVDLHALCALLPSSFLHPSHFHPLTLAFSSPYEDRVYTCNVCGNVGDGGRWLYRCSIGCDFDAHLHCIVVAAPSRGLRFQQAQRSAQQPPQQPRLQQQLQPINPYQQQRPQLQQITVPHPIPRQQPWQQRLQPRPQHQPILQPIPQQQQRGLELRPQQQQQQQRMPQLVPQLQQQQFIRQSIPQQRQQQVHPPGGASSMQPPPVATQGMMDQMSLQRLKMTDESMQTSGQSMGVRPRPVVPASQFANSTSTGGSSFVRDLIRSSTEGFIQGVAQQVGSSLVNEMLGNVEDGVPFGLEFTEVIGDFCSSA